MERTLFKRAAGGQRLVRGELVRKIQLVLKEKGSDPGRIDGIFGGDTEEALKDWQGRIGRPRSGALSFDEWTKLTEQPAPTIRDRCLQLTADFEQHGFGKVVGNFDGAWLTWGIIGFTLKHGEIQRIVNEVRVRHPQLLRLAFGRLESELMAAMNGGSVEQEAFANRISLGRNRYKVLPEWATAFETFGGFDEVQAIQMERVDKYWDIAVRDTKRFDLKTELGFALCFDIAVQNGGIDHGTEENSIRRRLAQHPVEDETGKRLVIADVVAENSKPKYVEDVRRRKRTIATGSGEVHGADYTLTDWAIENVKSS
jgi:peptidoglycan hydrolase-like protein with peptidoglycan-binding domain